MCTLPGMVNDPRWPSRKTTPPSRRRATQEPVKIVAWLQTTCKPNVVLKAGERYTATAGCRGCPKLRMLLSNSFGLWHGNKLSELFGPHPRPGGGCRLCRTRERPGRASSEEPHRERCNGLGDGLREASHAAGCEELTRTGLRSVAPCEPPTPTRGGGRMQTPRSGHMRANTHTTEVALRRAQITGAVGGWRRPPVAPQSALQVQ